MKEVRKLCGDTEDSWTVAFGEREVSFSNKDTTFTQAFDYMNESIYEYITSQ